MRTCFTRSRRKPDHERQEVLYGGKPEATGEAASAAARIEAQAAARRERLTVPGDPAVLARLAAICRNPEVGAISLADQGGAKVVRAGSIEGPVATRKSPDGSVPLVSAGPGAIGPEALVGGRDSQHEYVYTEVR